MLLSPQRTRELIQQIREVFADLPKPLISKRVARAYDDEWWPLRERCEELHALDTEESCWDLSDADVENYSEILVWTDPEGFRFYYPRYLVYVLEHGSSLLFEVFDLAARKIEQFGTFSVDELTFLRELFAELDLAGEFDPSFSDWQHIDFLLNQKIEQKHSERQVESPPIFRK